MSEPQFFGDDLDKGMFALTVASAVSPVGVVMLAADLMMRAANYRDAKNAQEAERRAAELEADTKRREEKRQMIENYRSYTREVQAAKERLMLDQPLLFLAEQDIQSNIQDRFINQQIGQYNLGSYRNRYQQNMIMNNRNLQLSRQKAIMDQTAQKLSGLKAQTAAAQADAAEKAAVAQQQREAYMTAIATKKDTMDQQARTYQDNLARSQNTLNLQQNIIQQNELANQRAQEQAAAVAASRALPTPSNKPRPPPRRLPPPVALPKY